MMWYEIFLLYRKLLSCKVKNAPRECAKAHSLLYVEQVSAYSIIVISRVKYDRMKENSHQGGNV